MTRLLGVLLAAAAIRRALLDGLRRRPAPEPDIRWTFVARVDGVDATQAVVRALLAMDGGRS